MLDNYGERPSKSHPTSSSHPKKHPSKTLRSCGSSTSLTEHYMSRGVGMPIRHVVQLVGPWGAANAETHQQKPSDGFKHFLPWGNDPSLTRFF